MGCWSTFGLKKSVEHGVTIPYNLSYCSEYKIISQYNKSAKLVNQTKDISWNLKVLKRQPTNSKGHMLLWFFDNLKNKKTILFRWYINESC